MPNAMPSSGDDQPTAAAPHAAGTGGLGLGAFLASVPFASAVVTAIAIACILGTVLPQGAQVQQLLAQKPGAGRVMAVLEAAGLTRVFSSWWFIALLLLLAASLSACTCRRYAAAVRARGRARGRALGSLVTHISMLLILAGAVVRVVWGERGQIDFRERETARAIRTDRGVTDLPFGIRLVDFEVEAYGEDTPAAPGSETLHIHRRDGDGQWTMPAAEGAEQRLEAAGGDAAGATRRVFRVRILRRIADFVRTPPPPRGRQTVKDYRSTLEVLDGDAVVKTKTIEVNDPLSYGGYTFYQWGFNPDDPEWTSLTVVRDPGVPLVYTGFVMLIAGLTVVFYLYPHGRHEA